ncbi:MAG: hypothetical protein QM784_30055 [Polyangiaceae bacterium]
MTATSLTLARWTGISWGLAACCAVASCGTPAQSVNSDAPRRSVPIPACLQPLPARAESQRGFMRQLTDTQYWKSVFPTYAEGGAGISGDSAVCTGEFLFRGSEFQDTKPVRAWPMQPEGGDLLFGAGPNRVKIVWFKTHVASSGERVGPLALVRADEEFAEVYGVGVYKGSLENSRFAVERLGGAFVVTAMDEGCNGKQLEETCENWTRIFVPWHGKLVLQANIATERRRQLSGGEPSTSGAVNYRLTAAPIFDSNRIRVLEQIQGLDAEGRKLRTAELERQIDLVDGNLVVRQPSLWDRVVESNTRDAGKSSGESPAAKKSAAEVEDTKKPATSPADSKKPATSPADSKKPATSPADSKKPAAASSEATKKKDAKAADDDAE